MAWPEDRADRSREKGRKTRRGRKGPSGGNQESIALSREMTLSRAKRANEKANKLIETINNNDEHSLSTGVTHWQWPRLTATVIDGTAADRDHRIGHTDKAD